MEQRQFQGIWIPANVWLDKRLNAIDKMILMEIISLDNEKGCIASNKYLADFCGTTERYVSKTITKLIKIGYVKKVAFDGRIRTLTAKTDLRQMTLKKVSKYCKKAIHDFEEREYTKEELLSVITDIDSITENDL